MAVFPPVRFVVLRVDRFKKCISRLFDDSWVRFCSFYIHVNTSLFFIPGKPVVEVLLCKDPLARLPVILGNIVETCAHGAQVLFRFQQNGVVTLSVIRLSLLVKLRAIFRQSAFGRAVNAASAGPDKGFLAYRANRRRTAAFQAVDKVPDQRQFRREVSGRSDQPSIGYSFRATKPCIVEIAVQTAEIGDSITVITDGVLQDKTCAPVAFEDSVRPPFIAVPRSREYYERLLRIAESWDAASFWLTDPPRGELQPIIDY